MIWLLRRQIVSAKAGPEVAGDEIAKKTCLLARRGSSSPFSDRRIFLAHPHYHEWYHETIGFNVAFGFLGGWLLIIVSKMLMMPLLQKKEDYYDEDDDGGDDNE